VAHGGEGCFINEGSTTVRVRRRWRRRLGRLRAWRSRAICGHDLFEGFDLPRCPQVAYDFLGAGAGRGAEVLLDGGNARGTMLAKFRDFGFQVGLVGYAAAAPLDCLLASSARRARTVALSV
jgi:hypothetical protein